MVSGWLCYLLGENWMPRASRSWLTELKKKLGCMERKRHAPEWDLTTQQVVFYVMLGKVGRVINSKHAKLYINSSLVVKQSYYSFKIDSTEQPPCWCRKANQHSTQHIASKVLRYSKTPMQNSTLQDVILPLNSS